MNTTARRVGDRKPFSFQPRIINPAKVSQVVIFSAVEEIREVGCRIREDMPWIDINLVQDPVSASSFRSERITVFIFDDTSLPFVDEERIRRNNPDGVLVLLSANALIQKSPPSIAMESFPAVKKADLVFAVDGAECRPEKIITSVIRCAEDQVNIDKYSAARRYIFLVIDDEPRWFSQFLPVLYGIIGQRAAVKITRTYEETMRFLFGVESPAYIDDIRFSAYGHGDDVVCLITDVFFPRGNELRSEAGVEIIQLINSFYPRIPSIIASKAKEASGLSDKAFLLPKGDPGSLQMLKAYIYDFTGIGDFLVLGRDGQILHRIRHIGELYKLMERAEERTEIARELRTILESYGRKDFFSTWLYMHGFREVADDLRPKRETGRKMVTLLKRHIRRAMLRMENTPLKIGPFAVNDLNGLKQALETADPAEIQALSDKDVFSTWLDRKCYPELAEEFRPIHGSGERLRQKLVETIDDWLRVHREPPR